MFDIAIVDDKFPYDIKAGSSDTPFFQDQIERWLESADWHDEHSLRELVSRLISTDLAEHKDIRLLAFLHPTALLDYLRHNPEPHVIVFDWEYQTNQAATKSQLIEVLALTKNAYVYVYTALANDIWSVLTGKTFDENKNRIQLLMKGDTSGSIFSSEENIVQNVISHFSKAYAFDVQGHHVRFEENEFIEKPEDLYFLESVLGKDELMKKLAKVNYEISNESMTQMLGDVELSFYVSKDNKYILDSDIESNQKEYGPLIKLSLLSSLQQHPIELLDKAFTRGIAFTAK